MTSVWSSHPEWSSYSVHIYRKSTWSIHLTTLQLVFTWSRPEPLKKLTCLSEVSSVRIFDYIKVINHKTNFIKTMESSTWESNLSTHFYNSHCLEKFWVSMYNAHILFNTCTVYIRFYQRIANKPLLCVNEYLIDLWIGNSTGMFHLFHVSNQQNELILLLVNCNEVFIVFL